MGECFTLQGLAGVTGVFRGLPPRILRMEVRAAEPAVTRWGPGDNLWVLQNVGDTGRDHSEDFCQGSRSSRQLRGERVWLKKLRVDKGTVLLPPSDVTHAVPVLCPPWGDPRRILPFPAGSGSVFHPCAKEHRLGRGSQLLPEGDPCSRHRPRRSLCKVPTPKRHRGSRCPKARRAKSSDVDPGKFRAQESTAGAGRSHRQSWGEEDEGCEEALRVRGTPVPAGMRPNPAESRASKPGVPQREMQMIPSSFWE